MSGVVLFVSLILLFVLFASHVLGVYRDGGFCHEPIMLHCLFARNRCSDQQHQDGRTFVAPQCDSGVLHFALTRLAQAVGPVLHCIQKQGEHIVFLAASPALTKTLSK